MKFKFKKIDWGNIGKKVFLLWLKHYKLLFFIAFLVVAGLGGYEWRTSLFTYSWTAEQRKAYLDKTIKETVFDEAKFLAVLEKLQIRQQSHGKKIVPAKDLFIGAQKEKTAAR